MMSSKEQGILHYTEACPVDVNIRDVSDIAVTISQIFLLVRVLNKVV